MVIYAACWLNIGVVLDKFYLLLISCLSACLFFLVSALINLLYFMASGADWRLIVISKQTRVGNLPGGHEVYRIDRIAALTLSSSESPEFDLDVSTTAYKFFYT